jgi:ribosome recycling factor
VRRDALNTLKRQRAAEEITEAKLRGRGKDIQAATDAAIRSIDELLERVVRELHDGS